jgi:lipid-binding SYLF domain-containing protein
MNLALASRMFAAPFVAASLVACQSMPAGDDAQSRRAAILKYTDETLVKLYAENPKAREELAAAAGYAVFDLSSVNAVLLVGQTGKGVLVDGRTRVPTYMKAMRAGTGPGLGYQELRQVFIFANAGAMEQFLLGKSGGGDVSASATAGTANVQQSFNPYISTYQFTERGFAVQANWGGTVYVADTDLACTPSPCAALAAP